MFRCANTITNRCEGILYSIQQMPGHFLCQGANQVVQRRPECHAVLGTRLSKLWRGKGANKCSSGTKWVAFEGSKWLIMLFIVHSKNPAPVDSVGRRFILCLPRFKKKTQVMRDFSHQQHRSDVLEYKMIWVSIQSQIQNSRMKPSFVRWGQTVYITEIWMVNIGVPIIHIQIPSMILPSLDGSSTSCVTTYCNPKTIAGMDWTNECVKFFNEILNRETFSLNMHVRVGF